MSSDLDPQQSIEIINKMIDQSKKNVQQNALYFLIWGWLTLIAALSHYALLHFFQLKQAPLVWPILMSLGGILVAVRSFRDKKGAYVVTHVDRSVMYLWGGITIYIFFQLAFMFKNGVENTYPQLMALYALGSFITGGILKFTPLKVGAAFGLLVAIAAYFQPFSYQLLLLALCITVCYLVPGYLLKSHKL